MPVICPKCSHVRRADASNPDWQCPACGICYAKFGSQAVDIVRPAYHAAESEPGWGLGTPFKVVLLIVLCWGLVYAIKHRQRAPETDAVAVEQQAPEAQPRSDGGAGATIANAALQVSGADAGMLHRLAGRLERGCARNQYGLSEQACIARLRAREDGCATQTAQRFPGQLGDTERMQTVARAYVGCIFEGDG